jgi:ABC-type transport system substrate-binding protein
MGHTYRPPDYGYSPYDGGWAPPGYAERHGYAPAGPPPRSTSSSSVVRVVVLVAAIVVVLGMIAVGAAVTTFERSFDNAMSGSWPGSGGSLTVPPVDPSADALAHDRAAGTPVPGGRLVFGTNAATPILDPAATFFGTSNLIVAQAIYDPLTAFDDSLQARPYLAEALTPSADFRQWTITLRPGVTFSDRTSCNASAVALALEANRRSIVLGGNLAPVTRVTVTDPLHLVVSMSTPWATFPEMLAGQPGLIAAPAVRADSTGQTGVGTGPFTFGSRSGDSITLYKNPHYWQPGRPYLDSVTFDARPDDGDRWSALEEGTIDAGQFQGRRGATPEVDVFTNESESPGRDLLELNTRKAPFDDRGARQAVSFGLDRTGFGGTEGVGYLGPHSPLFSADPAAQQHYDPVRARQLADQYAAATGHPLAFTLLTAPDAMILPTEVKRQLALVGIEVTIQTETPTKLTNDMGDGDFQAAYWFGFDGPTPEFTATSLIGELPGLPLDGASLDYPHYDDRVLADPFDRYRAAPDLAGRKAAMADVQKVLADEDPWIFLRDEPRGIAMRLRVHGALAYRLPDGSWGYPGVRPMVGNMWLSP